MRSKVSTPTTSLAPLWTSAPASRTAWSPVAQACSMWNPGMPVAQAARHQRRVPELPVPRHRRADDEVLQLALGDLSHAEDPVHRLAGELADVDLGQRRRLPRREEAAPPGPVGNPRPRDTASRRLHRRTSSAQNGSAFPAAPAPDGAADGPGTGQTSSSVSEHLIVNSVKSRAAGRA